MSKQTTSASAEPVVAPAGDGGDMSRLGLDPSRPALQLAASHGSSLRALDGEKPGTAEPSPTGTERRRGNRMKPDETPFSDVARLRPGVDVRVLDISTRGALIESPVVLKIGASVVISVVSRDRQARLDLPGTVCRCQVAGLGPVTYQGAVEFQTEIAAKVLKPFVVPSTMTA